MPLGTEVSLSRGDSVIDGDPAPSPKGSGANHIFGPCLLWPNGGMDQDDTWHGGRPQPRRLCVRWGPSSPPRQKRAQPPIFGSCLLWPNGCMHQDTTWCGFRPRSRRHCIRRGPSSPFPKGAQPPIFRPISVAAKWLHGLRCHLVWRQDSAQAPLC